MEASYLSENPVCNSMPSSSTSYDGNLVFLFSSFDFIQREEHEDHYTFLRLSCEDPEDE
jgi:hypothetical protein